MKTIGLIGGSSWRSSIEYYRIINEETERRLGGSNSAKCLMYSMNSAEVDNMPHDGDWEEIHAFMVDISLGLERGGADFIVICANTMHKSVPAIEKATGIPVLHIVDAVAAKIRDKGIEKVGLLGTKYTMEEDFYKERFRTKHDIETVIPDKRGRKFVNVSIYDELVLGKFTNETRKGFVETIDELSKSGAEGVVLGCTEIPLLINQSDCDLPLFDTTSIHALAAVDLALGSI